MIGHFRQETQIGNSHLGNLILIPSSPFDCCKWRRLMRELSFGLTSEKVAWSKVSEKSESWTCWLEWPKMFMYFEPPIDWTFGNQKTANETRPLVVCSVTWSLFRNNFNREEKRGAVHNLRVLAFGTVGDTYTHIHTISHSHSQTHTRAHTHTHTHSLSLSHTHTHTQTRAHSHTH